MGKPASRKVKPPQPNNNRALAAADRTFFANLFASIAEEMGVTLARTAYSPNIKERRDFSCAVFDAAGRLVAQAAHIPVHLGAMPMSVAAARRAFPKMRAGDVICLNDPFAGGTHLPDITLVTPVFAKSHNNPCAYLATRAHHADVGGMSPGSLPLSREIYQEGLRIPPIKLYDAGTRNQAVLNLLYANVRTPIEREGDLRAQLAAHEIGAARLAETLLKYGAAPIARHMSDLLAYGESLMRSVIRAIPDGEYAFADALEGDGIVDQPLPIRVRISIKGERASVDFAGSAAQCAGSLNAVEAITRSAVYYCFLCLLATPSRLHAGIITDPPLNEGCFAPIRIIAPAGSIVNAQPPAAVAGGNVETSQRIVDAAFGALAQALPDIIPAASQGTMNNLTLGGTDPRSGRPFAYYETIAGGMGARPDADGLDAVHIHMTNTLNTPGEALEFAYPLRLERYEIVRGSGGRGRYNGGCGVRRDVRALADMRGALLTERRESRPWGLAGGGPGKRGRNSVVRNGKAKTLPAKTELDFREGDTLSIRTPGGGGWGRRGSKP